MNATIYSDSICNLLSTHLARIISNGYANSRNGHTDNSPTQSKKTVYNFHGEINTQLNKQIRRFAYFTE